MVDPYLVLAASTAPASCRDSESSKAAFQRQIVSYLPVVIKRSRLLILVIFALDQQLLFLFFPEAPYLEHNAEQGACIKCTKPEDAKIATQTGCQHKIHWKWQGILQQSKMHLTIGQMKSSSQRMD